jgi:hypothetical protein
MKEINSEMEKLNQEIGYRQGEIKITIEKYGEENAKAMIECIQEEIANREEKLQILKNAEMILLGIDYKKYQ